jgi:hypothetical protein
MSERTTSTAWGVRCLLFLGLAVTCLLLADLVQGRGPGSLLLVCNLGVIIGVVGAAVCSVHGLRNAGDWMRRP